MNEDLLAAFSPGAQRALMLLARSPEDAVHLHARVTVQHAALVIGCEVIEGSLREQPTAPDAALKALMVTHVRAVATALECTLDVLARLHPDELGKTNRTRPPKASDPPKPTNRIRPMELD